MFTGIVEELGTVAAVEDQGDAIRLTVRGRARSSTDAAPGRLDRGQRLLPDRALEHDGDGAGPPTSCRRPSTRPRCGASSPGDRVNLERAVTARQPARRPHRPGPRRRRRHGRAPHAQRALGGRRGRAARRPRPLPRRQGLDHRRRRQPHRRRGRRADSFTVSLIPETLARTTLGRRAARRPGQPRGRRPRQARRAACSPSARTARRSTP